MALGQNGAGSGEKPREEKYKTVLTVVFGAESGLVGARNCTLGFPVARTALDFVPFLMNLPEIPHCSQSFSLPSGHVET